MILQKRVVFMKDAKTIVRNYRITVLVLAMLFIGIIILLNFLKISISVNILSFLLLFIVYRVICVKIAFKQIHSILHLNFDAPKYKEVIFQKGMKPNWAFQVDCAAFNGEYQTVINLCSAVIKGKFKPKSKLSAFLCMARSYYEIGDIKNLDHICNEYDEFLSGYTKKVERNIDLTMQYYKHFLLEEYDACFSILAELDGLRNQSPYIKNIRKIFITYSQGVLYYKTGDFDNAIVQFNNVIETAPKLQSAKLAQNYIDAIKNSTEFPSECAEVLPEKDFKIPFLKFRKILIFSFRLLIIIEILIIAFISITSKSDYDNKVLAAVNREYFDRYVSYMNFDIEYENKNIAAICVVQKLDGNYDMWFLGEFDNSNTIELIRACVNFNTCDSFFVNTPYVENARILFGVYDNAEDIPHENFGVLTLYYNDNPFYLVATNIYV